jgi:putative spermidine/putrescine transport system permease protein
MSGAPPAAARRDFSWAPAVPALSLIVILIVLPYISILGASFTKAGPGGHSVLTVSNYTDALSDSFFYETLARTLGIGLTVSVACLLIGYPVALHLARLRSRWGGLLYGLVLSPLLVGLVVRTFAWAVILSDNGVANGILQSLGLTEDPLPLMNNTLGVVIGLTHIFLPFMVISLLNVLQSIDPRVEAAARSLGASAFRTFLRVTLPLSLPGIITGSILVFLLGISSYLTPLVLGGGIVKTIPILVVQSLLTTFQWNVGAALSLILACAGMLAVLIFLLATSRWRKIDG